LLAVLNIALAQELSEKEEDRQMAAMVQYTLKYRFDKDLKVGDWVKYQKIEEQEKGEKIREIELKVTKKEKGGVWIVEKFEDAELHLLVDLNSMKLLKVFGFDEEGKKREAPPLSDKELAEAVEMMKKEMEKEMKDSPILGLEKGAKKERVTIANCSFNCEYLELLLTEQYIKRAPDYVEKMKKESRLYFSEDVPRLLPLQILFGPSIDVFQEVKGGLVKSRDLEIIAYSGRAGRVDCGTAKREKIAKEQPKEKLPALSEKEMKKLLPEQWPDDWHIFIQRIADQTIEHCEFMQWDSGGLWCKVLLQKGTATEYGVPTQQAIIKIIDLRDPSAEEQFTPIDRTDKGPDGTVGLVYEAITFNGHKAQLMKLPGKKNTIFMTYRSGRFEIRVNNHVVDQGITLDDLKVLCRALNLPKQ
jgi:peroxiredoxin family protein